MIGSNVIQQIITHLQLDYKDETFRPYNYSNYHFTFQLKTPDLFQNSAIRK